MTQHRTPRARRRAQAALDRRSFLKGAAGLSVATPLLFSGTGRAQGAHPKRLVIFFTPNGTRQEDFWPYFDWNIFDGPKSETDWPLTPILNPLADHKSDLIILDGVRQRSTSLGPGDGHQKGMGHLLTGMPLQEGTLFEGGGDSGTAGWAGGISIDQHIANAIGENTKFPSLEFGVRTLGATVWSRMCYAGAGQPIPPDNDPNTAFNRIFGELDGDPAEVARLRHRRQSVLDFVIDEFNTLNPSLGADDRIKLDQHLTAVREIEQRLESESQPAAGCMTPDFGAAMGLDPLAVDNFPLVGQLQMDLLAMSLACDLTRVASIQWTKSVGDVPMTWLGINEGHHALSHEGDSNTTAQNKLRDINIWYAQQLNYLIEKLKSIPEGNGTVFDNTLIVWCNELGKGNSHTRNKIPFVLAGSAGGALTTGRYLDFDNLINPGAPHNNLWVSVMNAMGVEGNTFGHPLHCDGALEGLA